MSGDRVLILQCRLIIKPPLEHGFDADDDAILVFERVAPERDEDVQSAKNAAYVEVDKFETVVTLL